MNTIYKAGEDATSGSTGASAAAAAFDGKLSGWPEDSLQVATLPTEEKLYIAQLATEIYKNTNITNPKQQADDAIKYARIMYNLLKSHGYL